ncbi:hypothetical protein ACJX0J_017622, partial [Zea mays]
SPFLDVLSICAHIYILNSLFKLEEFENPNGERDAVHHVPDTRIAFQAVEVAVRGFFFAVVHVALNCLIIVRLIQWIHQLQNLVNPLILIPLVKIYVVFIII